MRRRAPRPRSPSRRRSTSVPSPRRPSRAFGSAFSANVSPTSGGSSTSSGSGSRPIPAGASSRSNSRSLCGLRVANTTSARIALPGSVPRPPRPEPPAARRSRPPRAPAARPGARATAACARPSPAPRRARRRRSSRRWRRPRRSSPRSSRGRAAARRRRSRTDTAATVPVSGERSRLPSRIRRSHASRSATRPPVIDAQRVPPSACSTSQSTYTVRSPSALKSITPRSERPISRWISTERPSSRPFETSRCLRSPGRGGEHPVLGGDPAAARTRQPPRHALLHRGGADHACLAHRDQRRAGRGAHESRLDRDRPQLVRPRGRSSAPRPAHAATFCRQLDVRDLAERHLQEARPELPERLDVSGALEPVVALAALRVQQPARGERSLDAARDAGARGDQRDVAAERSAAASARPAGSGCSRGSPCRPRRAQRRAVAADRLDDVLVEREPALDDRREVRAGDALQVHVRVGRA